VPELAENGPYAAVDYWLQDHPHAKPMWFHYDLCMSVESGMAVLPTFSALVYLQDGAPVMVLPHTMACLESFGELVGCSTADMVTPSGFEYDRPLDADGTTPEGHAALRQAYLAKAKAGSILVFDGALLHGPLPHPSGNQAGVTGQRRELLGIHFWRSKPDFGGQVCYKRTTTCLKCSKFLFFVVFLKGKGGGMSTESVSNKDLTGIESLRGRIKFP